MKVENIFTILKDGSLHMGGLINNETDATNLSDQITLSNEYLIITADGRLRLSFDNIINTNSNESIVSYISNSLSSATSGIISQMIGRYHNHYIPEQDIQWYRPESAVLGGVEYNFSELQIDITYHNTSLNLSVSDFLNIINYYSTLRCGSIYTDYSTI